MTTQPRRSDRGSASRPTQAQLDLVERLLVLEGAGGTVGEWATSAGRVFDKFHAQLDPLIGASGVRALLVRSAKLVQSDFPFVDVGSLETSVKLRECLHAQDASDARRAAVTLFGTFIALIATFIGERLTTQALRGAWGTIDAMDVTEKTK